MEWQVYYSEIEPFGEEREDIRAAMIACVMANCFSKQRHKLSKFLLKFGEQEEDHEAIKAMFKAYTIKAGGTVDGRSYARS
jgi:hypothetical protein